MPSPLDIAEFYTLKPETQDLVMAKAIPEYAGLSPEAKKIVLKQGIQKLHTRNLQAGQALEGSKQAITPGGRLTGPITPPPTITGELGKGLIGVGKGALHAVQGVGQMAQGITDPMSIITGEMQRQQEISKKPQSLATDFERIPLLGPAATGVVEDFKKATQGTTEDFGEVLGRQGLPILAGAAAGKAIKGAKTAAKYEPASAVDDLAKAFQANTREQLDSLAEAHPAVHKELINKPTGSNFAQEGTQGYLKGVSDAQKTLGREVFEPELKKYGANVRSVDPVAQNVRKSLSEGMGEIRPELKDAIDKVAGRYEGKHWSYNKIFEAQKELRRELDAVDKGLSGEKGKPIIEAKRAELKTLNNLLYDDLSNLSGKDFTAARYRYKALNDVEDLARKADDRVSTMDAAGRATRHPILEDIVEHGPTKGIIKGVKRSVNKYISPDPNHPNALIAASLKKMGGKNRLKPIGPAKPPTIAEPPTNPEGPYAGQPGPTEPNQSMEQYLNMNNVSPEAQQFLGYRNAPLKRTKSLSEPPTGKP